MAAARDAIRTTQVVDVAPVGAGQTRLVLADPDACLAAHHSPGQYCMLGFPGGAATPFALMSTPDEGTLSFLVRGQGEPGTRLAASRPGDDVEMSAPRGPGFDLTACVGRDVVLVATGTGIAPIRAALTSLLEDRGAYGAISLYYGLRNRSHSAVEDELPGWLAAGVTVLLHFSDTSDGYVQDRVIADLAAPSDRAYVVAGHREVAEALRAHARDLGPVVENL